MSITFRSNGLFLWIIITSLIIGGNLSAQPSAEPTTAPDSVCYPFEITIEQLDNILPGESISIPVFKTAGTRPIGGFELVIAFDDRALTLLGVSPGLPFDSLGVFEWEVFHYRVEQTGELTTVHILGIADQLGSTHEPDQYYLPNGIGLFSLNFIVSENITDTNAFIPVSYYWTTCADNALASPMGDSLYISAHVYGPDGADITDTTQMLPSFYGAPMECHSGTMAGPYRFVNFVNGGLGTVSSDEDIPFAIEIGRSSGTVPGEFVTIPITKIAGSEPMEGFDFLINYDDTALTFVEAIPGELWDIPGDYEWEFFSYRYGSLDTCISGSCPGGSLRISGIANTFDSLSNFPKQTFVPNGTVLFTLKFYAEDYPAHECQISPLNFFWFNCTHNAIAIDMDSTVISALSNRVYSADGIDITDPYAGFPGIYGAPEDCFNLGSNSPINFIDYHNGYIGFDCNPPVVEIGDINANSIAFEIADGVMFANFLLRGFEAFGNHVELSTEASDINGDGIPLQLEDFILLQRVICGTINPPPLPPPELDSAILVQHFVEKTISFQYHSQLAAIHLIFDGEIVPGFAPDSSTWGYYYYYDGYVTRVLIFGGIAVCDEEYSSGRLFSYTGDAQLIEAQVADNHNRRFTVEILHIGDDPVAPYTFKTGRLPDIRPGDRISVPVVKTSGTGACLGFDLNFIFPHDPLLFRQVNPGVLFDTLGEFGWEYFNYRISPLNPNDSHSATLKVIALADMNNGSMHPQSTVIPDGTVLFTIDFDVSEDISTEVDAVPIMYYWDDCTDNVAVLDTTDATQISFSRKVFDPYGVEITDHHTAFPTIHGAPDICLDFDIPPPSIFAARLIDFYNGEIVIHYGVGTEDSGLTSISPNPITTDLARTGPSHTLQVYLGGFESHSVRDIDLETIRVNDTIIPLRTGIHPSMAAFDGEVLEMVISARQFITMYPGIVGVDMRNYAVTGRFSGTGDFAAIGTVTLVETPAMIPVPSGWTTIQAAIDVAVNGDHIILDDGVYSGEGNTDLHFDGKSLSLYSENNRDQTIIDRIGDEYHYTMRFDSLDMGRINISDLTFRGGKDMPVLYIKSASPSFKNCSFIDNRVPLSGVVSVMDGSGARFDQCLFESNVTENCAAFCIDNASPIIDDCEFSGNQSVQYGSALTINGPTESIIKNCTFVDNRSDNDAVIYISDIGSVLGPTYPSISNCIIAFNESSSVVGLNQAQPDISGTDIYGNSGGDWIGVIAQMADTNGNFSADPMFCDFYGGDYHLQDISACTPNNSPSGELIGAYGVSCLTSDAVDDKTSLPSEFRVEQNYPNPFNPSTSITFNLPQQAHVTLEIFNITGQKIVSLADEQMSAGESTIIWDGRDSSGRPAATGVYFYRLQAGDFTATRKMIMMK